MLIDPYLSDFLAVKYAGKEFPHARMMPPPLRAEEIRELDLVLCSHRHGDHMDPGSLGTLAKNNPRCRFVVPKAEIESALQAGLSQSQLLPVDDGDTLDCSGAKIGVIPAAHGLCKPMRPASIGFLVLSSCWAGERFITAETAWSTRDWRSVFGYGAWNWPCSPLTAAARTSHPAE